MTAQKITIVTEMRDKATGKLRKLEEKVRQFNKSGTQMVETTRKINPQTNRLNKSLVRTTRGLRTFKMEWLGVMFAGMALYRVFGGIIRKQMETWGLMEGFSSMLTVLFIPIMEYLSEILWPVIDRIMDLGEGTKLAIGALTLFLGIVGAVMMVLGQFQLGVSSILSVLGKAGLGSVVKSAGAFLAGLSATALAVIGIIVAVVVGMYLAWKDNILGMKKVVEKFIEAVKYYLDGVINIFKGILNIIVGLFTGDFQKVKEGIVEIFKGLWQILIGGFKMAFHAITAIAIGALTIIYNMIKVIIDGVLWLSDKVSKFIGGGGVDFRMPNLPSFQSGGIMPHNGLAYLHKGEKIIPSNQVSMSSNPNIIINATIENDYDVRRLAEELKRYWVTDFERATKGRGI